MLFVFYINLRLYLITRYYKLYKYTELLIAILLVNKSVSCRISAGCAANEGGHEEVQRNWLICTSNRSTFEVQFSM